MDYAIIIQSRMGSTRAPGKCGHLAAGIELLVHQIKRLTSNCDLPVIVATTNSAHDNSIEEMAHRCDVPCFRGSEDDVLNRYYEAASQFNVQNIIRVTGDDPLIDPGCIFNLIEEHRRLPVNYLTTHHPAGWIYGTSAELIEFSALEKANTEADLQEEREHVSPYLKSCVDVTKRKVSPKDSSLIDPHIFLTVDFPEDVALVTQIIEIFDKKGMLYGFTQHDLIDLYYSGVLDIGNKHLHDGFDELNFC